MSRAPCDILVPSDVGADVLFYAKVMGRADPYPGGKGTKNPLS